MVNNEILISYHFKVVLFLYPIICVNFFNLLLKFVVNHMKVSTKTGIL